VPELQPQAVHYASGNLVLDGENVGQRPVIAARPHRKIIAHANQLGVDAQLLTDPKDGTFDDIVCCQILSHHANVPRLAFECKRGGSGPR
jgi:hypothetical protein